MNALLTAGIFIISLAALLKANTDPLWFKHLWAEIKALWGILGFGGTFMLALSVWAVSMIIAAYIGLL